MTDLVKIEEMEGYLYCVARQFNYTRENILPFFQAILKACEDTGKNLVFIDFTAIRERTPDTLKAMAGFLVEELLSEFDKNVGRIPRIALLGVAPHISSYKPAEKILQGAGMPVAIFTEKATAEEWLFEGDMA